MTRRTLLASLAALVVAPCVPTPAPRHAARALPALELSAEAARRAIDAEMVRASLALDELGRYANQVIADLRANKLATKAKG